MVQVRASNSLDVFPAAASEQSPEPSTASPFPAAAWPSVVGSTSAELEAWLDAACSDGTLWQEELPSPAEAAVASQAQLLSQCDSLWEHPGEPEVQQAARLGCSTPQPGLQFSPGSAPATPLLSPVPSSYGGPAHGLGNLGLLPLNGDETDSRSQTEELDDSCGGSTVSPGFTEIAQGPAGTPAKHMLSQLHHTGQPLPRRESQPYSSASAHGAAVPSETVFTSDDEGTRGDQVHCTFDEHSDLDLPDDVAHALGDRDIAASLADLDPVLMDSDDPEQSADYELEGPDSEDEDSSDMDSDAGEQRFCVNCTARLHDTEFCSVCHRHVDDDYKLFSAHPEMLASASRPAARSAGTTALVWDERMQLHSEASVRPHPERPDRIRAVMARLLQSNVAERCQRLPCREATAEEVSACHRPDMYNRLEAASMRAQMLGQAETEDAAEGDSAGQCVYFTADTYANPSTAQCARLAAGASVDVAVAVATGHAAMGAAIVRPPGHHAESGNPMGFCFFNNAAVAAHAARAHGAERVVVLDFDVHHGNGTQHIFEEDPSVLYMSVHRHDGGHFYPGTGSVQEVGQGEGEGFTVNVPWPMGGMGDADYMAAFMHVFLPIIYEFSPDLIVVSAGYDAAKGDPMGGCRVSSAGFGHMTALLAAAAPLAVILEGGYNLDATAAGVEATMRVLLGERPAPLPSSAPVSRIAMMVIHEVIARQSQYWRCLQGLTQRPGFNPCSTHFPIPPRPAAHAPTFQPEPPALLPAPQALSPVQAKRLQAAPHTAFAESAAAAHGTALTSRSSSMSHAQSEGENTAKSGPTRGLTDLKLPYVPRLGSADAASSPTKVLPGVTSPRSDGRQFVRSKLQAGRFEGKRQRRWAISHALHLVALHTLVKRQALPRQSAGSRGAPAQMTIHKGENLA